jgi:hypothetical protein
MAGCRSLFLRHGFYRNQGFEVKVDYRSGILMWDAGGVTVDVTRGEHRQNLRMKLLDKFAVTHRQIARRVGRESYGTPCRGNMRTLSTLLRDRRQGVKGEDGLCKLIGSPESLQAAAGHGLRVAPRASRYQQHLELEESSARDAPQESTPQDSALPVMRIWNDFICISFRDFADEST